MWKFQGSIKIRIEISRGDQESLAFGPGSSLGCKTIFPGLKGEASFYLEFLRIEWQT